MIEKTYKKTGRFFDVSLGEERKAQGRPAKRESRIRGIKKGIKES